MTVLKLTWLVFLLNPKIVALWIDLLAPGIQDSWEDVCEVNLAGLTDVICASVWIKLFNFTGKHSRLSFIFLEKWKKISEWCSPWVDPFHLSHFLVLDVDGEVKDHAYWFGVQLLIVNIIFYQLQSHILSC